MTAATSLAGWRVLVPRGGQWGETVAHALREAGARPTIAPLINFAPSSDQRHLAQRFDELAAGDYDWLMVTSATTVDVFAAMQLRIPATTRVAALGETTVAALQLHGYACDYVPTNESSTLGLIMGLPQTKPASILLPQSEMGDDELVRGLRTLGHRVIPVGAYRTVGVAAPESVVQAIAEGEFNALLVTSGSVAAEVGRQFEVIPEHTLVVCIGPRTAHDAIAAGLPVDVIAQERSVVSMIESLVIVAEQGLAI